MDMCCAESMVGQKALAPAPTKTNSVRIAANSNAPKFSFHSKMGISGQVLAGSGALVFEGELLEIA